MPDEAIKALASSQSASKWEDGMRAVFGGIGLAVIVALGIFIGPAWGQTKPEQAGAPALAVPSSQERAPGHVLLQMPLAPPEVGEAFFNSRVVPPSNVPEHALKRVRPAALDARAQVAAPALGHALPAGATTPFGWPRADFAVAPAHTGPAQPATPTDTFNGPNNGPRLPGRRSMNETDPSRPVTKLGLADPTLDAPRVLMAAFTAKSVLAAREALVGAGVASLSHLSNALVTPAAAQTLSCTPPFDDPEIVELARALNYSLPLIYEYVYYNIEFTPTWGLKKGALGTYLDRRGNQIDQNELFVALLRQSCITANFRYGVIGYPASVIANLFGVANDQIVLTNVLGNGGFTGCVQVTVSNTCPTTLTHAAATRVLLFAVWTEATANGKTYDVDPSLKSYTLNAPINLASAMGYSQSAFLSAALAGSSSISGLPAGVNSIQNVNRANIAANLNLYAQNLATFIQTNLASSTTAQVYGGKVINNTNYGMGYTATGTVFSDLPSSFATTFTVTVSDHSDGSSPTISTNVFAHQVAGRRLTLTYNSSSQPVLAINGTVLATGAATSVTSQTVSLSVSNPYPAGTNFATGTVRLTVAVAASNTFALMLMSDEMGRDQLTRHQDAIKQSLQAGNASTSEPVLGESLAAMGDAYISQAAQGVRLSDQFLGLVSVWHAVMGVAGQTKSPYVDFPGLFASSSATTASLTNQAWAGSAFARAIFDSMLESTTVTQLQKNPAISTVRLIDIANGNTTGFIDANSSNWTSLQSSLTNWNSTDLTAIGNFVTASSTRRVILPQNGATTLNQWSGAAWWAISAPSATALSINSLISGGLSGGDGTQ